MEYVIHREGNEDYLEHYGVKGQKHGERRYQNADGSLTPEGREHYGIGQGNRYQNSDGSLTKAGIKERQRMAKWYDSKSGKVERQKAQKLGLSDSEAYSAHRASVSAGKGWFIAGPIGAAVGVVVNQKRLNSGKDFIESTLNEFKNQDRSNA